jgi:hypothetical protein
MAESSVGQYCSISEAVKLISVPLDSDRRKLKEFVDKVTTAFELVTPEQHTRSLLSEFVIIKWSKISVTKFWEI